MLSDHIQMNIVAASVTAQRAGFGLPLILSHTAGFPERFRLYSKFSAVLDDFVATSGEARLANSMFRQSPRPAQVAIGRAAGSLTQSYNIDINLPTSTIQEPSVLDVGVPATLWDSVLETRLKGTTSNGTQITTVSGAALGLVETPGNPGLTTITYVTAVTTVLDMETLINDQSTLWRVRTPGTPATVLASPGDTITAEVSASGVDGIPYPVYTVGVGGLGMVDESISVTWDVGDTASTIASALSAAMNAVANKNYTATDTASAIAIVGNTPNAWFSLAVDPLLSKGTAEATSGLIKIFQDHSAPTDVPLATDLSDIMTENNSWFWLATLYNSSSYMAAASTWASAIQFKMYVPETNDTRDMETSTGSFGGLDVLGAALSFRTAGLFHHIPSQFAGGALIGNLASRPVGSWTAKWKQLVGVTASNLTSTQRLNILARNANLVQEVSGINIMQEGTTALGSSSIRGFIDDVVNLDWLQDDMEKGLFEALAGAPKIPRTDAGMVTLEEKMRATLQRAVIREVASDDPAPTVDIPLIATMDDLLPRGVRAGFEFTLAGAVHNVIVDGNVFL